MLPEKVLIFRAPSKTGKGCSKRRTNPDLGFSHRANANVNLVPRFGQYFYANPFVGAFLMQINNILIALDRQTIIPV